MVRINAVERESNGTGQPVVRTNTLIHLHGTLDRDRGVPTQVGCLFILDFILAR